jgi:hypothetical protein
MGFSAASALAYAPGVKTGSASNVQARTANLGGYVLTDKNAVYGFEYGLTTAYGSESNITEIGGGALWQGAGAKIEGLQPKTTYHYRLLAMNDDGTTFGADGTFTTLGPPTFQADKYPASLSLSQGETGEDLVLSMEGKLKFQCTSVGGSGQLSAASSTLTISPSFSGCKLAGISATAVNTNGCTLQFDAGTSVGLASTMDLACPAGKALEVIAGSCQISVPAANDIQSTPGNFDGDVYFEVNGSGLEYVKTKDGLLCPFSGTGAKTDGSLTGRLSVSATYLGANIGIAVK